MPNKLQQSWPAPRHPKPIVIIGAGGIVRDAHLPAYKKAGLAVKGVFDIDMARATSLAEDWSLERAYQSLQQAVEENATDSVYDLATPPRAIAGILRGLPEGSAVLIQKPMGTDLRGAREIRAICRERQFKAAMNFQLRFSPMMMALRGAVEKGMLGALLEIEVHLNIYSPWRLFPFLIAMERVEIAVHSIHYLDTIRAIAGNPKAVFARTLGDPRASEFAQTRTSAILDYGADLRALMTINHNHQCGRKFQSAIFRIEGTEGAMRVKLGLCYDYPKGEADELWSCRNGAEWQRIELEGEWFPDAFMGVMRNLQRFAAGEDEALFTSVEDGYQTMALVEACYEANQLPGVPLKLD
ncbi:MAG: Gfo/Idh/MocA family oxidoreductase [Alphaproteobacteria bacterium]|jgi:predicted dehydrogenase|nr:Gfo/Idh/MocA family oxidoreductase [Alphaproteobacteria bacterium]|tara:strand:+ start:527 stop:1591 length:1065 start_codon:yes stop_codon:yes gene_type:complete